MTLTYLTTSQNENFVLELGLVNIQMYKDFHNPRFNFLTVIMSYDHIIQILCGFMFYTHLMSEHTNRTLSSGVFFLSFRH